MHVKKTSINGNPNVGLYAFCAEEHILIGPEVPENLHKDMEEIFQGKVHVLTIAGTSLLGVFLNGNKNTLLVPDIAYDYEIEKLKALGLSVQVVHTHLTCLGNNLLVNDEFGIISTEYDDKEAAGIAKALDVPVVQKELVGVKTVGSIAVMNSKGCLIHFNASEEEKEYIKHNFKVNCEHGSVNLGNPYLKSGLLASDKGFIMGGLSGGPELAHADRVLGFLEDG